MGSHSISVNDACYRELARICKQLGTRFQPFVESAIYEKIRSKNPNSMTTATEIGLTYSKFREIKEIQDMMVQVMKFYNFFGSYSDQNRADMLSAMGNPSREDRELVDEVFDSGKYAAKQVRPLLKDLVDKMKKLKSEDRLKKAREKLREQG